MINEEVMGFARAVTLPDGKQGIEVGGSIIGIESSDPQAAEKLCRSMRVKEKYKKYSGRDELQLIMSEETGT